MDFREGRGGGGMMDAANVAALFGCTVEQAKALYAKNAKQHREFEAKARASGKKYRGFTADEWAAHAAEFEQRAA